MKQLRYDSKSQQVTYRTKKGKILSFKPMDFIAKLTQHIPGRYQNMRRYAGYYAANVRLRIRRTQTNENKEALPDTIIAEMNGFRNAAEGSGFANDVDVEVMTYGSDWDIAPKRGEFLRDKVRAQVSGSWDYNARYQKAPSNEVYFQVKVN